MKNASIENNNEYIVVTNLEDKKYIDNNGNVIEDISNLKSTNFPEIIGEYKLETNNFENVIYTKK